jgi:CDP-diglyceride synthetase
MWEQYKKTFWGMQLVIALVTCAVYLRFYHLVIPTVSLFLILQAGSVAGAFWASQLKRRFQSHV